MNQDQIALAPNSSHGIWCRLMDALENCRGVAVVDAMGDGQLGLACGNWQVYLIQPKCMMFMAVFEIYVVSGYRAFNLAIPSASKNRARLGDDFVLVHVIMIF